MIEIDYEEGQRLKRDYVCGKCGSPFEVTWGGHWKIDGYVLRCGVDPTHEGMEKVASYSQAYKRGDALPKELENVLERKYGGRTMTSEITKALVLTPQQKGEIKKFLESSFEGTLAVSEANKAYSLVEQGFDSRFHICLYHKKVTLLVDGWYWWARQDHRFSRVITNPITDESLLKAYGVGDNEIGCIADLYIEGIDGPAFRGFGRASKDENAPVIKGSFVEHLHPYRLAEKRAEVQALRKFRPIGVAVKSPEELSDPLFKDDVIEGEATVLEEELFPPITPTKEKSKPKAIKRDTSLIKTKTDFDRACHEDFPHIDAGDRLRHTGYGSAMDVPDWETAYMELAGKMGATEKIGE